MRIPIVVAGLIVPLVTLPAVAASGSPPPPTVADVQAAYERAAATSNGQHDDDLKVLGIDCSEAGGARFTCTVGFAKTRETGDRVYLDSALVEMRAAGGWTLLQGLCRRLL